MKNEKYSFPHFVGFVYKKQIVRICHPFREDYSNFPDPVPRVVEMLGLRKFAELAVVSSLLRIAEKNMEGDDPIIQKINLQMRENEDPNLALLFQHHRLLSDSLLLTMNQGILRDDRQVHFDHIDLAEQVVAMGTLLPTLNLLDLPPLEEVGGRTDYERSMQQMLKKYDRSDYYRQFFDPTI